MMSWKKILPSWLCASLAVAGLAAQSPSTPAVAPSPATAAPPAATAPVRLLRHILVAESVEAAQTLFAAPDSGFVVLSPGLATYDLAELSKRLAPGVNQPIEEKILAGIKQVIEIFFKQASYPKAELVYPSQNIAEGDLRVIVNLGEKDATVAAPPVTKWIIRNIDTQGGRWFNEAQLRRNLQIEPGQLIRYGDLEQAINWTNNNPYRRIRVHLEPVPGSGEVDVTINVLDALPLRVSASVDNSGNDAIGKLRYIASANYANLWGRDHQLGYQFVTTDKGQFFHVHGFDYRVPLPRRHSLQFSGSYLEAKPEFYGGVLVNKGQSINADLRYTVPLRTGDNSLEASATLSFKQTNNNLLFFGATAQTTKTDIVQLTTGLTGVWRDKRGAWGVAANLTASPGGATPLNTTAAFDAARHGGVDSARIGATASYAYFNVSAQRLLNLAPGWDFVARGAAQVSQANLLSSEQFNIGGANSVRGFSENRFAGDNGYSLSGEFLVPPWKLNIPRISKFRGPLEARLLSFVDFGDTSIRRNLTNDHNSHSLASTGLGLRSSLSYHFSLTADYGWQLSQPSPQERAAGFRRERGVGHLKATLAF